MRISVLTIFLLGMPIAVAAADLSRQTPSVAVQPEDSTRLTLKATERLPDSKGSVTIERSGDHHVIKVDLAGMQPALLFGGDLNTYVVWLVSGDGMVQNAGELTIADRRSRIEVSTELEHFGLLITVEPHFLVELPSAFVVFELPDSHLPPILFKGFDGHYRFERDSLNNTKAAKGTLRTSVHQAFTAVRFAQRSQSQSQSRSGVAAAERALQETVDLIHENADPETIEFHARETVRFAVAAQKLAEASALTGKK